MLNEKMEKALNDQIKEELYSMYIYMGMAAYLEAEGYRGMARWMLAQSQEEYEHAMRMYAYINDRGGRVRFLAIDEPKNDYSSVVEVFEDAYEHEKYITGKINELMDLAHELKDYATIDFLQWYVDEQVEEEVNTSEIARMVKMASGSPNAMFMLDRELGSQRTPYEPWKGAKE